MRGIPRQQPQVEAVCPPRSLAQSGQPHAVLTAAARRPRRGGLLCDSFYVRADGAEGGRVDTSLLRRQSKRERDRRKVAGGLEVVGHRAGDREVSEGIGRGILLVWLSHCCHPPAAGSPRRSLGGLNAAARHPRRWRVV